MKPTLAICSALSLSMLRLEVCATTPGQDEYILKEIFGSV